MRLTLEDERGHLWSALYPASAEIRQQLGEGMLERLYVVLAGSVGREMTLIAELEVGSVTR
jgi:hypothetical protein